MHFHMVSSRKFGVSMVFGLAAAAAATYALLSIHRSMQHISVTASSNEEEAANEANELRSWDIEMGYLGDDEKEDNGTEEERRALTTLLHAPSALLTAAMVDIYRELEVSPAQLQASGAE
ncbi:uncharacterized protein RCC_07734 [Ramularia collo-cygni]|uniref:Uncharacterized protein n=1 Tax=Ramularia collo-cygni TaxID=112498 RepID=A0A2D3VAP3_9PEZI|nr:uncharacterized protein RCC_07734 [Ramularia collo-cygni]CZT21867.1 uncharacterized protein RCC_07734 [Ramularia collo-cygni]